MSAQRVDVVQGGIRIQIHAGLYKALGDGQEFSLRIPNER
jgi:hypothetical protein